jgi:hypothetical protein
VSIYGDCVRFFRNWFVVGSFRQNRHRNIYYDALTAALSFLIATVCWRDTTHITDCIITERKSSPCDSRFTEAQR